jgi:hypothetical protein
MRRTLSLIVGVAVAGLAATANADTYSFSGNACNVSPYFWTPTILYFDGSVMVANGSPNSYLTVYCPIIVDPTANGIGSIQVNVSGSAGGPLTCTFNGFDATGASRWGSTASLPAITGYYRLTLDGGGTPYGVIKCDIPPVSVATPGIITYSVSN